VVLLQTSGAFVQACGALVEPSGTIVHGGRVTRVRACVLDPGVLALFSGEPQLTRRQATRALDATGVVMGVTGAG
jgi:hypothetical protein